MMHIAMVLDDERLLHEAVMLNRLCIGLVDEGCTVTRITPAGSTCCDPWGHDSAAGITTTINVPLKVLPWLRRARAEQVAQTLTRSEPDVVYGFGHGTWPLTLDLSKQFDCAAAINIWSADQLRSIPRGKAARSLSAYIAATRALAEALRNLVDPALVSYVPQGVAISAKPRQVCADPQRPFSIAIIGSGRDLLSYRALLSGLSRILKDHDNVLIFLELRGPQQHEIWKHARRLELLNKISAITDAARFRSLLTQCDMLVLPERYGEVRSLTLDALAMGLPVVAADDPYVDFLIADETAVVVLEPEPDAWAGGLRKLLSSPEFAQQLGMAGRHYVQEHHRSSIQVSALLETLKRAVHGDTIDFGHPA